MHKEWDTLALCDRFFDALESGDYDTLEACYAPECVVWHSHDMLYQSRASNLAMLKQGMATHKKMHFTDRRVNAFEGGFVQQHRLYVTRANDYTGYMDVCFIAYTRDGMIKRVYEYFDTSKAEQFTGVPLPA